MKNIILALFTAVLMSGLQPAYSQLHLPVEWKTTLGGLDFDRMEDIHQTADGGYIIAGNTRSDDFFVTDNHGAMDYWIIKLNSSGGVQWKKCFGGSGFELTARITLLSDGGYAVAGRSQSSDGNVTANYGNYDAWIVNLDAAGNIRWQISLGTNRYESANDICETTDGSIVFTGTKQIVNNNELYIGKLSSLGAVIWEKTYGGQLGEEGKAIKPTSDGGFIIAADATSNDGDVTGHHGTSYPDVWVVKTDADGNLQWEHAFGGSGFDMSSDVIERSNGNFVVSAHTGSTDGDVDGFHAGNGRDFWILQISSNGSLLFNNCFGGSADDLSASVNETSDGGLIITGDSYSLDGDRSESKGFIDYWIVKLNPALQLQWEKSFGGTSSDIGMSGEETADGGFIFGGYTYSNDGDVSGNHSLGQDIWVIKTGAACILPSLPSAIKVNISGKVCPGDSRIYSVNAVAGNSYQWSLPQGAVITSGSGSNQVHVLYTDSFIADGLISVKSVNACGESNSVQREVKRNIAPAPGSITGTDFGLCGMHNVTYSITPVAGYGYQWTVPGVGNITSGQGTTQITVNYKPMNFQKEIKVSLVNGCGPGVARKKVIRSAPQAPAAISGNPTPCANTSVNYSIAAVSSATSYTWIGPAGSHITANGVTSVNNVLVTTSTTVSVNFAQVSSGSYIKVRASNACGDGGYRALNLQPCVLRVGEELTAINIYPNPVKGGSLFIESKLEGNALIKIYNAEGMEVMKMFTGDSKSEINVDALKPGIYFIRLEHEDEHYTATFIRQ